MSNALTVAPAVLSEVIAKIDPHLRTAQSTAARRLLPGLLCD